MSGNPNNAAVWANADVYVGALTATDPTGGDAFGETWDLVGLLSGDDGFTKKYATDSTDFYAWGGILVATTRKNFKLTMDFTPLEDNATVFGLVYPGSDVTFTDGVGYAGDLMVPDLQHKFKMAFQTENDGVISRLITRNYAQVDARGDSKEGESDLASHPLTVAIYPDSNTPARLFKTFRGAPVGSS